MYRYTYTHVHVDDVHVQCTHTHIQVHLHVHVHIYIYIHRCDIPVDVTEPQQRLDLILTWIFEHPNALQEEEVRIQAELAAQQERERIEREREIQESSQTSAAQQFLSSIGEVCMCAFTWYVMYMYVYYIVYEDIKLIFINSN